MKKAIITGITGQDGSYLAELLLEKGYEVWGTVKRNSVSETQSTRIEHLRETNKLNLEYADLTDMGSLISILSKVQPDDFENLLLNCTTLELTEIICKISNTYTL